MVMRTARLGKIKIFLRAAMKKPVRQQLYALFIVNAIPALVARNIWFELWTGTRPQSWDGSGHYTMAQFYSQSVFPDTFGWTHMFFSGIPSPNFYPPLFYWLVALLEHSHLFSFLTAFKLVLVIPVLLLPTAIWTLTWRVSGKKCSAAAAAALIVTPLLTDYRFFNPIGLMGINYTSTFMVGMYSQTLGFVLLIAWYVLYSGENICRPWRFALSSLLLALALLANFFSATVAVLFVVSTVFYEFLGVCRQYNNTACRQLKRVLTAHALSPLIAVSLTLFWTASVINSFDYFVTRPRTISFNMLVPSVMWVWYALAAAGVLFWLRRPTQLMWPYLTTCLASAGGIFFSATVSPRWFPLYPPRLITTLNLLLAVPAGIVTAAALQQLYKGFFAPPLQQQKHGSLGRKSTGGGVRVHSRPFSMIAIILVLLIGVVTVINWVTPTDYSLSFYQTNNNERIDQVLRFAERHRDGRYLVEVPPFSDVEASLDARAINSYLGMQGNEAVSLFFREAAPNVLFFNPLVNALSTQPDAIGISSVLTDDREFNHQSLSRHLERARFAGIRYLVMATSAMKNRLTNEALVEARHDLGVWSVFDIGKGNYQEPLTGARPLTYRPALVVSDFSFKLRRREEYEFVRFAEEQFNDNWFDVLLALSPELRIDHLHSLENFGAVIIDTYKYDNEARAFDLLRDYAQRRKLIMLTSDSPLFHRIKTSMGQFPHAQIIDRPLVRADGDWVVAGRPTFHYGESEVRRVWREIQQALDQSKVIVNTSLARPLESERHQLAITIIPDHAVSTSEERLPVLIPTTYHPNWRRTDGDTIYPATPFFMLTFAREPMRLVFARRPLDWAGLVASAATLLTLCAYVFWSYAPSWLGVFGTRYLRARRARAPWQAT